MKRLAPRIPRKMLVLGFASLLVGAALLLKTTGFLSGLLSLWPIALVAFGMFLLYLVFFKNGHETYVFAGIFLILVGGFFLIVNTGVFEKEFRNFWPLFMLFAGVSLFFYGLKYHGSAKARMIIPAVTIILLSLVFLLFSLGLVAISFRRFVVMWWPALLVFAGITLIVLDIVRGRGIRRKS